MSSGVGKAVIHYVTSDGGPWVKFIQKKLGEDQYGIPTESHEMTTPWHDNSGYDVNLVLVSPDFLVHESFECLEHCNTDHSLAILLGTQESEFREAASVRNARGLLTWTCYCPEQTQDSVKGLLLTIIDLYETVNGGDEVADERTTDTSLFRLMPPTSCSRWSTDSDDKNGYATLPPVRQLNALYDVLQLSGQEEDGKRELLVLLDRAAESELVLKPLDNADTPIKATLIDKAVYRASIHKRQIKDGCFYFIAASKDQTFGTMEVVMDVTDGEKTGLNQARKETYVQSVSSPSKAKSDLDTIRNILEQEMDPVSLLCRALRIPESDHDELDKFLSSRCRNMRITNYFTNLTEMDETDICSDSEWPTLLHFCADNNLVRSTDELLRIPSLVTACLKCNINRETPRDIARRRGFTDLAALLEKQYQTAFSKPQIQRNIQYDSGIMDQRPESHHSLSETSMRERYPPPDSRNVDSGWSEMDDMDIPSPDRITSPGDSIVYPPRTSTSDTCLPTKLRPSGNYDQVEYEPTSMQRYSNAYKQDSIKTASLSQSRPVLTTSRSFSDSHSALTDERRAGETKWYVDSEAHRCPRRNSESELDYIRSRPDDSNKSPGKNNRISKWSILSKVLRMKKNTSFTSSAESTILEETAADNKETRASDHGFPCSPIELSDDGPCPDVRDNVSTAALNDLPKKEGRMSKKDKTKKQRDESSETPTRSFKMLKNPFHKKKVDRRKSLRMSRVMHDNNVAVIALPSKCCGDVF